MSLPSLAVHRPVTTLVLLGALAGLGVLAAARLSVDFLPSVSVPCVVVGARMPDANAIALERQVTRPLEDWLSGIAGLRSLSSVTRRGQLAITAVFHWGTDVEDAVREARERVEQAMAHLPPRLERPTILAFDPASDPIMTIGVMGVESTGDAHRLLARLRETALSLVKKRLEQLDGVARVDVVGGVERVVRIELIPERMRPLGIQPSAIPQLIADGSASLPAGSVRVGGLRLALTIAGGYNSLADVLSTPVAALPGGGQVTLSQIARGVDTIAARTSIARVNGNEAVTLLVRTDAGANTVLVSRRVRAELQSLELESPALRLSVLSDDAEFVERAIADVGLNMLAGIVLAVGVLVAGLRNARDPLIAAVAIPISVLGTCLAMWLIGVRINIISLAGLGLGIGMLGDNALVVIESARRMMEHGAPVPVAAVKAAEELQGPLAASTLTNAAIFLPVLAVPGVARELFADMAITMTSALAISLLVALTLVPLLLSRERVQGRHSSHEQRDTARKNTFQDACVRWSVRHAGGVVAGSVLLLGVTVAVGRLIPTVFVPAIDQRRVVLTLTFPGSTPLDSIAAASASIEGRLNDLPGVELTASCIGSSGTVRRGGDLGARADIEITPRQGWLTDSVSAFARACAEDVRRSHPAMTVSLRQRQTAFEQILRPFASSVSVHLLGGSDAQREAAVESMLPRLRRVLGLVDLHATTEVSSPELRFVIDDRAAALAGVSPADIIRQLGGYARDRQAAELPSPEGSAPITVAAVAPARGDEFASVEIITPDRRIPLRSLGHWQQTLKADDRRRINREGAAVIAGDASGRSLTDVLEEVEDVCRGLALPPEIRCQIGGEADEIRDSFAALLVVLALSLLLVFMVLAAQYESFRWPLVVLLVSPLAATGTVVALLMTGEPYSVFSLVGVVITIGAIDNDAVIVVEVARTLRQEGRKPLSALREAFRRRIRSIILTTATTVLGMVPFLLGIGTGLELVSSMTSPLTGGLVASTAATLIILPAVYVLVDRGRRA